MHLLPLFSPAVPAALKYDAPWQLSKCNLWFRPADNQVLLDQFARPTSLVGARYFKPTLTPLPRTRMLKTTGYFDR